MLVKTIKQDDLFSHELNNLLEKEVNLFHSEVGYINSIRANINILLGSKDISCDLSIKIKNNKIQEEYSFTDTNGKEFLIMTINGYNVMALDGRKTNSPKPITFFNNFLNNTSKVILENSSILLLKNLFLTTFTNGGSNVVIDSWVDKYESYLLVESIKTKSNIEFLLLI